MSRIVLCLPRIVVDLYANGDRLYELMGAGCSVQFVPLYRIAAGDYLLDSAMKASGLEPTVSLILLCLADSIPALRYGI